MIRLLKALRNYFLVPHPVYIVFFVTARCNAGCRMCFNWENIRSASERPDLSLEEIRKVFGRLGPLQQLTLSGGEPFLREDLPEIVSFISRTNDVQMITLPTNAILTDRIAEDTARILAGLRKTTHLRMGLSVQGLYEQHDEIVRHPGAFQALCGTYRRLKPLLKIHPNFNIDVTFCCNGYNKESAHDVAVWCLKNFPEAAFNLLLVRGSPREPRAREVTPGEYEKILAELYQFEGVAKRNKPLGALINAMNRIVRRGVLETLRRKHMPGRCTSGDRLIVVQNNGDVFPCECLPEMFGNLRDNDYDLSLILKRKENRASLSRIREGACHCTWECAHINNIVTDFAGYPRLLRELLTRKIS